MLCLVTAPWGQPRRLEAEIGLVGVAPAICSAPITEPDEVHILKQVWRTPANPNCPLDHKICEEFDNHKELMVT